MAPVSSLHFHTFLSHTSLPLFHPFPLHQGTSRSNKSYAILCCNSNELDQTKPHSPQLGVKRRRELLFQAISAAFAVTTTTTLSAFAAGVDLPEGYRFYTDETNKYKIVIPQDWQVGNGAGDGIRSLTAFYPQQASNSNVSLLITGLGADFTRLESFGKVDEFAENLVSGIDRSWQRPPGVAAKLVDSKSSNGMYYIEYTLKSPGESRRHLYSVLGVADNGVYNRLYTLTGQFTDEEEEKFGPIVQKAVSSFRLIK